MTQSVIRSVLIAAMGGQGGGVLTDWLVVAARAAGLAVQSTSIPGVAQRTGATTYYVEMSTVPATSLPRRPIFGLYPSPGAVDVVVAAELVEAGRMLEKGFVTPDRTVLVASAARLYATVEKSTMTDGRADAGRLIEAASRLPRQAFLLRPDAPEVAGHSLNALLFGVMAGCGALPISPDHGRTAIRSGGKAVAANLSGFELGLQLADNPPSADELVRQSRQAAAGPITSQAEVRLARYPEVLRNIIRHGIARLMDYQGADYAARYLDRLEAIIALDDGGPDGDYSLARETARHLALWMSYEDVVRVAQLKTRPERLEDIRGKMKAGAGQPLHVTEFMKPGLDEVSALLPPSLGRRLRRWVEAKPRRRNLHVSMHLRSNGIWGFTRLWLLAGLRRWRPRTLRYAEEQAAIEHWLAALADAASANRLFAAHLAEMPRLLKGYSDTHRRGQAAFSAIMARVVEPAIARGPGAADAERLEAVIAAALGDPEGDALSRELSRHGETASRGQAVADAVPEHDRAAALL